MPNESHLFRSLSLMDVPQRQPVAAVFTFATAFRRDRSPSRLHPRRVHAESARQAFSGADYVSSLYPSTDGRRQPDDKYFSRSAEFEFPAGAPDRPKYRCGPRASFDENSVRSSNRLQIADIIPHTCGRQRSSTMSHRSLGRARQNRQDRTKLNTLAECSHSQQRFSSCPSPRSSPVPHSTNIADDDDCDDDDDASWSSGQDDATRYDRQSSIHQSSIHQAIHENNGDRCGGGGSGRGNQLARRQSSNVEWESPRERSPPLSSTRAEERSAALSADIRRRLNIELGSRAWRSDESARPLSKKTAAVEDPRPTLIKQQTIAGNVPMPQQPRNASTRTLTRAMTIESGASSTSSTDKKHANKAFLSTPSLFDPLTGRTLTLKSLLPKEKKALRMTFSVMNNNMFVKLMEQILHRLETNCPEIRSLFFTTAFVNSFTKTPEQQEHHCQIKTIHDHAKIMAQMFEDVIKNLDTYDVMVPYLRQYGQKHALMCSSGFKVEVLEKFGELAVVYIGKQDCIKYNHIAVGAWRLLIACITDEMRFGFERECKKNDRQNSFSEPADVESLLSQPPSRRGIIAEVVAERRRVANDASRSGQSPPREALISSRRSARSGRLSANFVGAGGQCSSSAEADRPPPVTVRWALEGQRRCFSNVVTRLGLFLRESSVLSAAAALSRRPPAILPSVMTSTDQAPVRAANGDKHGKPIGRAKMLGQL
uniref:Globin family profile domain-containing protein n=1 Tax=Plectus sambesii TaxID=2011161 RepID=A0A914WD24_9BILA